MTTYDDHDDFIRRQLASLRSDVDGLSVPGPAAARKRAAQRTRHQVTGTALAGVAAVAAAAVGITQPTLFTAPEPVDPSVTDTVTVMPPSTPPSSAPTTPSTPPSEPTNDPTGTDEPDSPPPEAALLIVDDVVGDPPDTRTWTEVPPPAAPVDCAPPTPDGALEIHFEANRDGGPASQRVDQFVEATDFPEQRIADLAAQIQDCVTSAEQENDRYGLVDIWPVTGAGDEAWIGRYWAPMVPPSEDVSLMVTVQMVRHGSYVSVVVDSHGAQDVAGGPQLDRITTAATRLCEALGTTCVDSPTHGSRIYPELSGHVAGWMDPQEVGAVLDLPQIGDAPLLAHDGQGWAHQGLPVDPAADGAETIEWRIYVAPADDGGPTVDHKIATFPDAAAAKAHYDRLVAAADAFVVPNGYVLTNTGGLNENGFEAMTWRLEDPAADGHVEVYGAVVQGDAVSVVYHRTDFYEQRDVTADQMHRLLRLAGEGLTMR